MKQKNGAPRKPSRFEELVKAADPEEILRIQKRLENSYKTSGTENPKLLHAIQHLHTEPGWFLNVNGIYRDIIIEALEKPTP